MQLTDHFMQTIIPWVIGVLTVLVLLFAVLTIRAWRDSKRSPYFFLRRQAEQQMQTYSLSTLALLIVSIFVGSYAWQAPRDTTPRVARIVNAKPLTLTEQESNTLLTAELNQTAAVDEVPESIVIEGASGTEINLNRSRQEEALLSSGADVLNAPLSFDGELIEPESKAQVTRSLPPEFDQYEPTAELNRDTTIGSLTFSTEVDNEYSPLNQARVFNEGFYTIYATFDYAGMQDGMEWAWVWRREGQVTSGGNELWAYGDEGPGFVYLNPPEGFQIGEYTLEIWVNGKLMAQSNIFVTNDVAANN